MSKPTPTFLSGLLHLSVLAIFAITQPLFDVVSQNPPFFLARNFLTGKIILTTLLYTLGVPVILGIIEAIAWRVHQQAYLWIHRTFILALVSLIALPIAGKLTVGLPGKLPIALALLIGFCFTLFYTRSEKLKNFIRFFSPVLIIIPLYFLFLTPITQILFPNESTQGEAVKIESETPIIFIIYDEFPITALMNNEGLIDHHHFPHFARLAATSTWYRNTTTVADMTNYAVPAILSGNYPQQREYELPTIAHYPDNLFTFLGSAYDMNVHETFTLLCPLSICEKNVSTSSLSEEIAILLSDSWVLYQHIILPSEYKKDLPKIDITWANFANPVNKKNVGAFANFAQGIRAGQNNQLNFVHMGLPHRPFLLLPSGKYYDPGDTSWRSDGLKMDGDRQWHDQWSATQTYQRHLLQVGFLDGLLGALVDKLQSMKLFDQALIVLTADHGMNFNAKYSTRYTQYDESGGNLGEILWVPLFIKYPNQKVGQISDAAVETIDILPTIADVLKTKLPWRVDGRSLIDPQAKPKTMRQALAGKPETTYELPTQLLIQSVLERNKHSFGISRSDPHWLYQTGRYGSLVGKNVANLSIQPGSLSYTIFKEFYYDNVDLNIGFTPVRVKGQLLTPSAPPNLPLAIALNQNIVAVSQTTEFEPERISFSAMIPEASILAGKNTVDVYVIRDHSDGIKLESMTKQSLAP